MNTTGSQTVRNVLAHFGDLTTPPRIAPARGPLLSDVPDAKVDGFDPNAQPVPDCEFERWDRVNGRFDQFQWPLESIRSVSSGLKIQPVSATHAGFRKRNSKCLSNRH